MKAIKNRLLAGLVFVLAAIPETGCQPFDPWPEITAATKPWTRWWWMGSAVDEKNLCSLLETYSLKGFGGVEVTPVYGAKGYEQRYIPFLSERWMQVLQYTCEKADSLGLGVDMSTGTGWPFGGPQVSPGNAAAKVVLEPYHIAGGQVFTDKVTVRDQEQAKAGALLQALVAYNNKGRKMDLTAGVAPDGTLMQGPSKDDWTMIAVFCGRTMQNVKRAAPGGEGFTLDHFSVTALDQYLSRFDSAFRRYTPNIRCLFNDSYEVYNASWTPLFFEQFAGRRGYDLKKFVPELSGAGDPETVARVKHDYRQTMSEMLLDHFTTGWSRWAYERNMQTRNQAHGSPANLLDLYAAVDIPEIETFGSSYFPIPGLRRDTPYLKNADHDPLFLRLAASAAHVSGKRLVSCETFTWLGEHFRVSLSQCKPEVEQAFLAGVNHVVYHGTAYSPEDATWPGWLFYASVNFSPSNSFWTHMEGLNHYITRCQSILQTGRPDNDMLVYWPIHDKWQKAEGMERMITIHEGRDWCDFPQVRKLTAAGYTFDFISDKQILQMDQRGGNLVTTTDGNHYKAMYVPACRYMPLETLRKLIELAEGGALIVFEQLPEGVPGLVQFKQQNKQFRQLLKKIKFTCTGDGMSMAKRGSGIIAVSDDAEKALVCCGIQRESLGDRGLKFIRRRSEEGVYYYLVNHTSQPVDTIIPLNTEAKSVLWMDPLSGEWGSIPSRTMENSTYIRVNLLPGQTCFVLALEKLIPDTPEWRYYRKTGREITVEGPWEMEFLTGGPALISKTELDKPVPWTSLNRQESDGFSGTAGYSAKFILPDNEVDDYLLVPGNVYESASVWINGRDAGIIWSLPFQLHIGKFLHPGLNTMRIEVSNLMANRIREMDRKGMEWKNFHDINIVNLGYKPFSAADWSIMPSGLEGPVRLVPLKRE